MPLLETFANASARGWNPGVSTALPAYELIATTVLGSNTATVSFTGLNTSAASYKHLQVRFTARSTRAVTYTDNMNMQINGDTTTGNYKWHLMGGDSVTVSSYNGSLNPAGAFTGAATGGSSTASAFSGNVVDILDFASTSKNKTVRTFGGSAALTGTNNEIRLYSSVWLSTAAITSLAFKIESTNSFVTGSRFSLYGLRG